MYNLSVAEMHFWFSYSGQSRLKLIVPINQVATKRSLLQKKTTHKFKVDNSIVCFQVFQVLLVFQVF